MGPIRKPGVACGHGSPALLDDGTLCLAESPVPSHPEHLHSPPSTFGGLVKGKFEGVSRDLLDYLLEVATFFGKEIYITDGRRSAEVQAETMLKNWIKLSRGEIYKLETLPKENRLLMDKYYKIAKETPTATKAEKEAATAAFLAEGLKVKSKHIVGDAVDLPAKSLTEAMRQALTIRLKYVREGKNPNCFHLQRRDGRPIPPVDDALRARWQKLQDTYDPKPSRPFDLKPAPYLGHAEISCLC